MSEISNVWFPLFVDIAFKAIVLLIIAIVVNRMLVRASAALRCLVWSLAVAGVLALPIACVALPKCQMLPSWMNLGSTIPTHSATGRSSLGDGRRDSQLRSAVSSNETARRDEGEIVLDDDQGNAPDTLDAHDPSNPTLIAGKSSSAQRMPTQGRASLPVLFALSIWLLGVCFHLLRLLVGVISLHRLLRLSQPLSADQNMAVVKKACRQVGIRRDVSFVQSDRRSMPMTWGTWRPTVLVPKNFTEWVVDRQHIVLVHELAHARRCDHMMQLLTRLACAIHWFNPLIWFVAWQMAAEREKACDDIVLRAGHRPSDYAEHLLKICRQVNPARFTYHVATAMARGRDMSARVTEILDQNQNRQPLSRVTMPSASAVAGLIVVLLGMLHATDALDGSQHQTTDAQVGDDPAQATGAAQVDALGDVVLQGAIARLGTTRWRHKADVALARFSPDGKILATAAEDTIRLWDVATGRQLHELTETGRWSIYGIAFAPDGATLASIQQKGVVRLWNVETGEQVCPAQEHSGERYERLDIAFAADGKTIATVGAADVRLWNAGSLEPAKSFSTGGSKGSAAPAVAFSPDGKLLAASGTANIMIWDLDTGQIVRRIANAHENGVTALVFAPDSRTLISGGNGPDKAVQIGRRAAGSSAEIAIWQVATGKLLTNLSTESFDSGLYSLALSRDGKTLVSGHHSEARIWDLSKHKLSHIIDRAYSVGGGYPCAVDLSPDGRLIAARTNGNTVGVWDFYTGRLRSTYPGHQLSVTSIVGLVSGDTIATLAREEGLRLWQRRSGNQFRDFHVNNEIGTSALVAAPGGGSIAVGGGYRLVSGGDELELHGSLQILGPPSMLVETELEDVIGLLAYSPDGKWLAAATNNTSSSAGDESILMIEARTGETRKRLGGHPSNISAITFSTDGRTLLSVGTDSKLRHWDLEDAKITRTVEITGHEPGDQRRAMLSHAVFSADSKLLVTCEMFGKTLVLTDVAAGQQIRQITVPDTFGNRVAISPNGQILASACQQISQTNRRFDERIHLWDAQTGEQLRSFDPSTDGTVASLAFLPDGKTLASGMDRGTVLLWDISNGYQEGND